MNNIRLDRVFKFYKTYGIVKVVLDHVSVDFDFGYSYGILGINGAGKSTLMRLLAGTELPNDGSVRRLARVSWPLGFAGGLHPKMTGRENVVFVARIYGQDIRKTLNFVEDFSEIGSYVDVPVESYSSGMLQRLAFGLSMAIDFDCYLIDEVTAVGDARFQARCQAEFNKRRVHSDILMISHDMNTLKNYCNRGIVLADGKLHVYPNLEDAIALYRQLNR